MNIKSICVLDLLTFRIKNSSLFLRQFLKLHFHSNRNYIIIPLSPCLKISISGCCGVVVSESKGSFNPAVLNKCYKCYQDGSQ